MWDLLDEFVVKARNENAILERNGAAAQAQARGRLLKDLEEFVAALNTETVTVKEAARIADVAEETVRRAVRNGDLTGYRANPRGKMGIRVSDVERLKGKSRKQRDPGSFDPVAFAREILAQQRR